MFKSFFLLILATILVGCSSTNNVAADYALDSNTKNGVLLTSIRYVGGYSGYAVSYSNNSSKERGTIQFGEGMMLIPIVPKGDYAAYEKKAELFAIELPEGEYQIDGWNVYSGYATISPIAPISIKFKVEAGKATYIGQFIFTETDSLGATITNVDVDYIDNYQEDSAVLKSKYPNISETSIIRGILEDAEINGIGGNGKTAWDIPIVVVGQ